MQQDDEQVAAAAPLDRGKRIVIFADGTGNAFSTQESNIWRLYQALDKQQKPTGLIQIARYMPGVGTASNKVIRYLDGITGFGVPSNVRKLYRFLCWNWDPGDEIYLFGFSRGAFTVRTLAGMVSWQGLMPRKDGSRTVGKAEMKRNVTAAWRAYRWATAPLVDERQSALNPRNWRMNPLIEGARFLRDGIVRLKRRIMGQDQHSAVLAKRHRDALNGKVEIRFMGVFDTVEAYGMPIREFNRVFDWLVWPIQFRNRRCSPVVQMVRHALSLDDERLTFHPLRFDQGPRPDGLPGPETQELWFAGMHSDVGGGYPDNAVSLDPLIWMRDEAAQQRLMFDPVIMARHERGRYPQALIHNSRAGLANFYRYAPRRIRGGAENGGVPVVHPSAVIKMRLGADGYAPLGLPGDFQVFTGGPDPASEPHGLTRNLGAVEQVRRLIRWRKRTNYMTILCIVGLLAIPFWQMWTGPVSPVGPAVLAGVNGAVGWVLPGFVMAGLLALLNNWVIAGPLILAVWLIYMVNEALGDAIRDRGRQLWA